MLGFISKLLARRREAAQRCIFRYWDGTRVRSIDPMVAFRSLKEDPRLVLDEHPRLAVEDDLESIEICASASRLTFGLAKYDGNTGRGVTDAEAVGVLLQFGVYLAELKKNTSGAPISAPPTASNPSTGSTTKPGSDSGSTPSV